MSTSLTSKDNPYGPSTQQVSTVAAKDDPDGMSWEDDGHVEDAKGITVETSDDARGKRYFMLSFSSNFFFLVGSAIYLWMAIGGWQWDKEIAAAPEPNYVDNFYFNQLPPEQQDCARALGYNQRLWDTGGTPPDIDAVWDDLTPEQQDTAECLGYYQEKWDGYETDVLAEGDEAAAAVLLEDDVVFQVAVGDRQTRVTRYMIQYFVAAMCFVVVGMLDLIREKKLFHCLMIIAGLFGVLSAMLVERNIQTSGIFNVLSANFFFLEAIAIFRNNGRGKYAVPLSTPFAYSLSIANVSFGVGALIEVVLSYFYLLNDYADFNTSASAALIAAQTLWVVCSLIYIVTDIAQEVRRRSHERRKGNEMEDTDDVDGFSMDDEEDENKVELMPPYDMSSITKDKVDV